MDPNPGAGRPAPGDAVESPPAPEPVTPSTDRFLARMRLERALWKAQRHTAGRALTRSERRLQEHLEAKLRAFDESEPQQ